mmetsp:Transcript_97703/g.191840  ORF Transcript_97703/g.191840 Transcript_97703/m.191840 type:complete len:187 (+) Transcript_97703:117-677(+)
MRRCSEPLFDRWTNVTQLHLANACITRPLLDSLIEFLNLPLAKDPHGTTGDEEFRWIWVDIQHCKFAENCHRTSEEECCTLEDVHHLFDAMAHRTLFVSINTSPVVVSGFLSIRDHHYLEMDKLSMDQCEPLSAVECSKLGCMIQQSTKLRDVSLRFPLAYGAYELFDVLAGAFVEDRTRDLQRKI